ARRGRGARQEEALARVARREPAGAGRETSEVERRATAGVERPTREPLAVERELDLAGRAPAHRDHGGEPLVVERTRGDLDARRRRDVPAAALVLGGQLRERGDERLVRVACRVESAGLRDPDLEPLEGERVDRGRVDGLGGRDPALELARDLPLELARREVELAGR